MIFYCRQSCAKRRRGRHPKSDPGEQFLIGRDGSNLRISDEDVEPSRFSDPLTLGWLRAYCCQSYALILN
jgi:hypothetical protein